MSKTYDEDAAEILSLRAALAAANARVEEGKRALTEIVTDALCDCIVPDGHEWKCRGTCPLAIAKDSLAAINRIESEAAHLKGTP